MDMIEKQFIIRNKIDSPDYYLSNDQKIRDGLPHISSKKYISEARSNYQAKHGCLRKEPIPMHPKIHPELDDSTITRWLWYQTLPTHHWYLPMGCHFGEV